jgi:hypothetical protein
MQIDIARVCILDLLGDQQTGDVHADVQAAPELVNRCQSRFPRGASGDVEGTRVHGSTCRLFCQPFPAVFCSHLRENGGVDVGG